jgi:tellurite methyltransferase
MKNALYGYTPFIATTPDAESKANKYISGELLTYYWDWQILYYDEKFFPCNSSGVPHRHAICRMIARRYIG